MLINTDTCTYAQHGNRVEWLFLMRATASQDPVALHRSARSAWIGLQSGSTMDECARGAYWRQPGPELDPLDACCARGSAKTGLEGGLRWRIKPDGHLPRGQSCPEWGLRVPGPGASHFAKLWH
jgi:hypothetical protein